MRAAKLSRNELILNMDDDEMAEALEQLEQSGTTIEDADDVIGDDDDLDDDWEEDDDDLDDDELDLETHSLEHNGGRSLEYHSVPQGMGDDDDEPNAPNYAGMGGSFIGNQSLDDDDDSPLASSIDVVDNQEQIGADVHLPQFICNDEDALLPMHDGLDQPCGCKAKGKKAKRSEPTANVEDEDDDLLMSSMDY